MDKRDVILDLTTLSGLKVGIRYGNINFFREDLAEDGTKLTSIRLLNNEYLYVKESYEEIRDLIKR